MGSMSTKYCFSYSWYVLALRHGHLTFCLYIHECAITVENVALMLNVTIVLTKFTRKAKFGTSIT